MWMPFGYPYQVPSPDTPRCCKAMAAALDFECSEHDDPFACNDALMIYHEPFDEYGIVVHDGGPSYVLIRHCPWCGTPLPESQRDSWFDETDAKGIPGENGYPPEYLSAAWRSGRSTPSKEA